METKICGKCKTELSVEHFHPHKKDKFQSNCKECQKQYRSEHYKKNKQKYIDKASKWTNDQVVWWQDYKSKLKCELCPETHPACLQFHHTDDNKEGNVATLARRGNRQKLLKEIEKCQVLCANCHFKLHFNTKAGIV